MFDLTNIYYPTYVIAIPNSSKLIYIPTKGSLGLRTPSGEETNILRFHKLKSITDTVLEGYIHNNKFCIYDALPIGEFNSGRSKMIYMDRRILLQDILTSRLADFNVFTELYNKFAFTPAEIKTFHAYCLTNGYKGSMVISRFGTYSWGKTNDENSNIIEIIPNGK